MRTSMDYPPKSEMGKQYFHDVPSTNRMLRAMLYLRFPLFFPPVMWWVKKQLVHCSNVYIMPGFFSFFGNIYAKNVILGNSSFFDYSPVVIGEYTSIGFDCFFLTAYHDIYNYYRIIGEPIVIGKNVTIYSRCTILQGVKIGDNAVIGAGSVVTHDIPGGYFAAGNPAKIIRKMPKLNKRERWPPGV